MERVPGKKFPVKAEDYTLYEEVGKGVSASVYRAVCVPLNEVVAIKVMDLERCGTDLDKIRREVQTMTLLDHPNLLKAHCSFVAGSSLWIVTPYMDCGSCFHIMKFDHPNGFQQQSIIATLLFGVLKALVYLHSEGLIHRDVKAGNVLVDSKGSVKLADFGVSASLFDNGDRRHARNTFVGTPCWMAPEVMQQLHGYDFKADIWSFGITALELAHGHAPFSNFPPMKVLLMTIQNAPPGLDYARDQKFSKSFKNLVSTCLVKDPKKRPTAESLLKHRFFKYAQSKEYVVHTILRGLPPLGDRNRMIKEKEASLLEKNKITPDDKEQISQNEYIRGISAWDFDPKSLKIQAALLGDDSDEDDNNLTKNHYVNSKLKDESDNSVVLETLVERSNTSDLDDSTKNGRNNLWDLDGLPASLPNKGFHGLDGDLTHSLGKDISVVSLPAGENLLDEASSSMSNAQFFENPDSRPKDIPNDSASECSKKSSDSLPVSVASMIPSLQYLLKQNSIQKEQIMKCLEYLEQVNESVSYNEHIQICGASPREEFLESQLMSMRQYNDKLLKDLEVQKMESAKLEQKLKALVVGKE